MIIINRTSAKVYLLEATQDRVEFPVELIDLEPERAGQMADWAIRSKDTKAVLFRSFYNRLPVVTLAEAYADWCGDEIPF
jgi:hypothetical protein